MWWLIKHVTANLTVKLLLPLLLPLIDLKTKVLDATQYPNLICLSNPVIIGFAQYTHTHTHQRMSILQHMEMVWYSFLNFVRNERRKQFSPLIIKDSSLEAKVII